MSNLKTALWIPVLMILTSLISCNTDQVLPNIEPPVQDSLQGPPSMSIQVRIVSVEPRSPISFYVSGSVYSEGTSNIVSYGFYIGTSSGPEFSGRKCSVPVESDHFSANLNSINPGMPCFIKAFANDGSGEVLSDEVKITLPYSSR